MICIVGLLGWVYVFVWIFFFLKFLVFLGSRLCSVGCGLCGSCCVMICSIVFMGGWLCWLI